MARKNRVSLNFIMAGIWLVFSVSLAGWWLIFGLKQIEVMKALDHSQAEELVRQQRMLMWEGSILLLSLLGGGMALLYYVNRERQRTQQIKEFFTSFSHDLKTSIASLRLQAESLQEDLGDTSSNRILSRLLKDTVRLELQLENSLFLANVDSSQLFEENLSLKKVKATLEHHWPELKIHLDQDCMVTADQRALESVLKNIIQNSIVHGEATEIRIESEKHDAGRVRLSIADNGKGFQGQHEDLARPFVRHYSKSGSGVGLFLAKRLLKKMGGDIEFPQQRKNGFSIQVILRGQPI